MIGQGHHRPSYAVSFSEGQSILLLWPSEYSSTFDQSNLRTDEYGAHSLHLLYRIVYAIRSELPKNFVLGIKINSADYIDAASDEAADIEGEQHAMEHIRTIASWGNVDFIEITGGTYDDPGTQNHLANLSQLIDL